MAGETTLVTRCPLFNQTAQCYSRDITSAASKIEIQGARYPEHLQRLVGR